MEWYQVLTITLSVFGMGWVMYANLGNKIDRLSDNIMKEMRDFHGRLCSLEEKYRDMEKK